MKNFSITISALCLLVFVASCEKEGDTGPAQTSIESEQFKANKGRPKTTIWSDGKLYGSVVTPAVFDGEKGNYDKLYAGNFYDGVGLISESKPGDQDYNGGRWNLYVLRIGVTTDYSMATSDTQLNPLDFESAETYFECPLLPRKGNH